MEVLAHIFQINPLYEVHPIIYQLYLTDLLLTSLEARLRQAISFLHLFHRILLREDKMHSSWEDAKACVEDYAFTHGFALVTKTNDKKNHT